MTDAQKKLVEDNLPLAYWFAHNWSNTLIEEEDREQIAMLGLCKAAIAYDPSRGAFSTIATKYMRIALLAEWGRREKHPSIYSLDYFFTIEGKIGKNVLDENKTRVVDCLVDRENIADDYVYMKTVSAEIKDLPPRQQEAVRLLLRGYKRYEAARIMGVSRQRIGAILTKVKPKIYAAVGR